MPIPLTRLWLYLPCTAVRVRAVLEPQRPPDVLRVTLARLLAGGRAFTVEQLDELLGGIGNDTVEAALERLALEDLVIRPVTPKGLWQLHSGTPAAAPVAIRTGWVLVAPHDGAIIPALWLGERPGVYRGGGAAERRVEGERPKARQLDDKAVQQGLAELCFSEAVRDIRLAADHGRGEHAREPAFVRSLAIDDYVPWQERRWSAGCWAAVHYLERVSGDAAFVVHEPQLEPTASVERPVSTGLAEWIRMSYPSAWDLLMSHARALGTGTSLVRELAGIASEAELLRIASEHAERMTKQYRVPPFPPTYQRIAASLAEAQEWLIISKRDAKYNARARDAYGHAIEALCQCLAQDSMPTVRPALAASQAKGPSAFLDRAECEGRLLRLGLSARLGPSEALLLEAVGKLNRWHQALKEGALGAGQALTLWLLPLTLRDDAAAAALGEYLRSAIRRQPELFDMLATLVEVRNDVFHDRTDSRLAPFVGQPEFIDLYLYQTLAGLLAQTMAEPVPSATNASEALTR
jgi:hypothetical protein